MNSINDFFQFYKKILKENKDININEEMIFNSLININIPNDQLDIEIDSLFDEWKTKYINYDVTIKNDYIEMSKGNLEVTSKIKVFISLDLIKNTDVICPHIIKALNQSNRSITERILFTFVQSSSLVSAPSSIAFFSLSGYPLAIFRSFPAFSSR